MLRLLAPAAALLCCGPTAAQSNAVPGQDLALGTMGPLSTIAREGSWPNGRNALGVSTTACNLGTVDVPWEAAMAEDHPVVAFLVAKESGGRMRQISGDSWIRHLYLALGSSHCTTCPTPAPGSILPAGCSDTVGTASNSDRFVLGPPEELDPWLGRWTALCSHFDRGEPPAAPPADCDGEHSLTPAQVAAMPPTAHRVVVGDADLDDPRASFWFQVRYVAPGEPLASRANDLGSRAFTPFWNGASWSTVTSGGVVPGTVLHNWSGAAVHGAHNVGPGGGDADGTVFVGSLAEDVGGGVWHYEYALHNVDNTGAFDTLRIPLATGASVTNVGFSDVDADASNDWTISIGVDEIVFTTSANTLRWNTIYNVWFDTNAAPEYAPVGPAFEVRLGQAGQLPGAGPEVAVRSHTPTGPLPGGPTVYCTAKTSSHGCVPSITFAGTPSASSGAVFDVGAVDVLEGRNGLLFYGYGAAAVPFQGGLRCVAAPARRTPIQGSGGQPPTACSGTYSFDFNARIRSGVDGGLVPGAGVYAQYWSRDPGDPFGTGLTDAVAFVVGG